ncbi:MAG: addiction module toxin RelE [Acidobacteria bacterium]|nr:MAG: addiction module toxin RelE [Acidobacteriota bacterium]
MAATWGVLLDEEFEPEFDALPQDVQNELLAHARLLQQFGPQLGRPRADTLNGSRHANMKELRFDAADGVWRVAFAFDPNRNAVLLVCGDKSGGSEKRFYRQLIEKADARFDAHLARIKRRREKRKQEGEK